MENKNIDTTELQEMKEQIAILKKKLENETIVNETTIRRIMNEKARKLRGMGRGKTIASFISLPFLIFCTIMLGCSLPFIIITTAYLSFAMIYTYITHRDMNSIDLMTDDLVVVSEKVAKLKKRYSTWFFYGIPFFIAWAAWFFYEMNNSPEVSEHLHPAIIGGITGSIIGGIFGIRRYRTIQRISSDILLQIDDLKQQ